MPIPLPDTKNDFFFFTILLCFCLQRKERDEDEEDAQPRGDDSEDVSVVSLLFDVARNRYLLPARYLS